MFFCIGVSRKNLLLVEDVKSRGSRNTRVNACIMMISVEKIAHMSVVWAYVSLWLCMFGCLLLGPIRLKVL